MKTADFEHYLRDEKHFSPHTIMAYLNDITCFADFIRVRFEIEEEKGVSAQMVRDWILTLSNNGMSARTICRKIASLRTFFHYLVREQTIIHNPMEKITAPKIKQRNPIYIQQNDISRILNNEIAEEDEFLQLRDNLILELFYATGVRQAEILQIKESDFDFAIGYVRILGKRQKERIIPMHNKLLKQVEAYIKAKQEHGATCEQLIIDKHNNPMSRHQIYYLIHRLLASANVEQKSPHILRHTFATHLLNNGADINSIKELLGHSSLEATKVYTHNSIEDLKRVYKQAHPHAE
ncbi:MAG: tyrosine-type recombinase/integrase [Bacteroidales bacterium]|jgi:integrase/recombinase XerC|nr:tyrosine-type recombinase/integrase [Bacteroidales bacterium]